MKLVCLILIFSFACSGITAQKFDLKKENVKRYLLERRKNAIQEKIKPKITLDEIKARSGESFDERPSKWATKNFDECEPTIAVNPTNPDNIAVSFVAWQNNESRYYTPVFHTFDGGRTWAEADFPIDSIYQEDYPDLLIAGEGDPVLAFDADGILYFTWIYIADNADASIFWLSNYWGWSEDGGQSIKVDSDKNNRVITAGDLYDPNGGIFLDRPWMAIDKSNGVNRGRIYIQGTAFGYESNHPLLGDQFFGSGIVYKDIGEGAFKSYKVSLDGLLDDIPTLHANISVDKQGALHSTFSGVVINRVEAYHLLSTDGSESFSYLDPIADINFDLFGEPFVHSRENPMPDAAIHPDNMSIHYTFCDHTDTELKGNYLRSLDGGVSWSDPVDINTIVNGNFKHILQPTIAVDELSGLLSIGFLGLASDLKGDFYVTSSNDNGNSWSEPCKVSSNTGEHANNSSAFWGDYWESKIVKDKTYCVWTDGRNVQGPKVYFGSVDHNESVNVSEYSALTEKITVSSVFPNPSQKAINLVITTESKVDLKFSLLNSEGKVVAKLDNKDIRVGMNKLDFEVPSQCASGSYLLFINSPFGNFTRKVILID